METKKANSIQKTQNKTGVKLKKFSGPVIFAVLLLFFEYNNIFVYKTIGGENIAFCLNKISHFIGGAVVAWFFALVVQKDIFNKMKFIEKMLFLSGCSALVGCSWEFAEFFSEKYMENICPFIWKILQIGDLNDTVTDLLSDILGGLFVAVIFKTKEKSPAIGGAIFVYKSSGS